jgi:hypothetical protein
MEAVRREEVLPEEEQGCWSSLRGPVSDLPCILGVWDMFEAL